MKLTTHYRESLARKSKQAFNYDVTDLERLKKYVADQAVYLSENKVTVSRFVKGRFEVVSERPLTLDERNAIFCEITEIYRLVTHTEVF